MKNILRITVSILALCSFGALWSCSNTPAVSHDGIIGIYKVTDRDCNGTSTEIDDCNSVALIEFVKGNFYKISESDVAFVIWRGEVGSDLLYSAKKYEGATALKNNHMNAIISDDDDVREEVYFSSLKTGTYTLEKKLSPPIKSKLTLERVSAADLKNYTREYPGNN